MALRMNLHRDGSCRDGLFTLLVPPGFAPDYGLTRAKHKVTGPREYDGYSRPARPTCATAARNGLTAR
jgi:hypothetical protein